PAAHRPAAEDRRPPPPQQGPGGEGRLRGRCDRLSGERLQEEEARTLWAHAGGRRAHLRGPAGARAGDTEALAAAAGRLPHLAGLPVPRTRTPGAPAAVQRDTR